MLDSNVIQFPSANADWSNPAHVEEWVNSLPKTTLPPTKLTAHHLTKVNGKRTYVRITRAAQVKMAGTDDISTLRFLEQYADEIDHQVAGLMKRGPEPATGWLLDIADLT